jgi:methionine synthase I (cobalamin-dependent)
MFSTMDRDDVRESKKGTRLLVGDGAMGTMLQEAGLPAGEVPEGWNISHPRVITEVHRQYLEAGADIIETNTFGGNGYKLRGVTAREIREINMAGSRLAREAAGSRALVAGSMGPTGCLLVPWGELSFAEAMQAYILQAEALVAGGADFLLIETMTDLQEARAAMFGAMCTGIPVAVQLAFDISGHTLMGTPGAVAAGVLSAFSPLWVGCNCGTGPENMLDLICQMRHWTDSVSAFPNAGLPEWQGGEQVYPLDPEQFALGGKKLFEAGASLVGGCCGTTPSHIQMLRKALGSDSGAIRPHDHLNEMVTMRASHHSMLEDIKWVVGEETKDYHMQSVQPGMFLASRTTIYPLGKSGVEYQLESVGSIENFEPRSWSSNREADDSTRVQIPIIEIPEDLESDVIASLVAELQIGAMPIVFVGNCLGTLREALLNYCGRAGIIMTVQGDHSDYLETAVAMGALPVYL